MATSRQVVITCSLLLCLAFSFTAKDARIWRHPIDVTQEVRKSDDNAAGGGKELLSTQVFTPMSADNLRLALFTTYPNSGTTYTMKMVQRYTNTAHIYNDTRHMDLTKYKVSDHQILSASGTPILFSSDPIDHFRRLVPPHQNARYLLTKTHCHGVKPKRNFVKPRLAETEALCRENYPITRNMVHSMVHLARNPLDNMVSRRRYLGKNQSGVGPVDFQDHCNFVNERSLHRADRLDSQLRSILARVPCAAWFFNYFEWHEAMFSIVHDYEKERNGKFPVIRFHYEDYESKWNETSSRLLDFLGVRTNGIEPAPFVSGKTYHDYYTEDQKKAVGELFHKVASPELSQFLGRYF